MRSCIQIWNSGLARKPYYIILNTSKMKVTGERGNELENTFHSIVFSKYSHVKGDWMVGMYSMGHFANIPFPLGQVIGQNNTSWALNSILKLLISPWWKLMEGKTYRNHYRDKLARHIWSTIPCYSWIVCKTFWLDWYDLLSLCPSGICKGLALWRVVYGIIFQILSSESISSYAIFRHFYQVNFYCQNVVNRKDEVGLDIRFSGVHEDSYQWWGDLFRCRIDLLNFSMGFNIIAPYMEFLHLNLYIAEWDQLLFCINRACHTNVPPKISRVLPDLSLFCYALKSHSCELKVILQKSENS